MLIYSIRLGHRVTTGEIIDLFIYSLAVEKMYVTNVKILP